MSDSIKISVLVPAYNVAPWLPRCLDSILSQSYKNLEVIVIDDGSTDETGIILDKYAAQDSRIIAIHQENGGVTVARLAGLKAATGVWIGFVDGDDAIDPNMYERLLHNAQIYDTDISHCGYRMVFNDGRTNYFHNSGKLVQHDRDTALKELLSGRMVEPGLWNKLFRAELFEKMLESPALDTSIRINEDLLMNFILFGFAERSVFEDFCPYQYIVRGDSTSRQKLNKNRIYDPIRVKERILSIAPENVQQAAQAAYLSTCINIYNSLALEPRNDFREDRVKVREIILMHRGCFRLLGRKQQILASLIQYAPWGYGSLYRYYAAHFLKNPYE